MKKLNITFSSFPDYTSHAKALYIYMKKKYKDTMNLVWIVSTEKSYEELKKQKIKVITKGSKEFEKYIYSTDVFFTTHGNLIQYKTNKSIYIDLWHGIGVKPAGYLINNLVEDDILWTNNFRSKVDLMIVPTEFWRVIFSSLFQIEPKLILPLGYPKFDLQTKSNGKKNLSKILEIDTKKYNKIIYYMPTHSKREGHQAEMEIEYNKIFNLSDESIEDFDNFLRENNMLLCIKRHPSDIDNYKKIETDNIKQLNNELLENNNIDVDEILNAADIMISDYSSLCIEFMFLRKKVIFINSKIKTYKKNRGIFFDNYEFWSEKNSINNYQDLKKSLLNDNNEINEEKYDLWYGDLKDGGCNKICEYLFKENKLNPLVKKQIIKNFNTKTNEEINSEIQELKNIIAKLEVEKNNLNYINGDLNYRLTNILESKSWKYITKIRKIYYKLLGKSGE